MALCLQRAKTSRFSALSVSVREDACFHAGKFDAAVCLREKFPLRNVWSLSEGLGPSKANTPKNQAYQKDPLKARHTDLLLLPL